MKLYCKASPKTKKEYLRVQTVLTKKNFKRFFVGSSLISYIKNNTEVTIYKY